MEVRWRAWAAHGVSHEHSTPVDPGGGMGDSCFSLSGKPSLSPVWRLTERYCFQNLSVRSCLEHCSPALGFSEALGGV